MCSENPAGAEAPQNAQGAESFRPLLDEIEARVLGCLIEKQLTTPETYPLTLNALVTACNQKTSREPVMNLSSGDVGHALRQLEGQKLVRMVSGARADRWEQKIDGKLELVAAQRALLGQLLLRGPQTVNELLSRGARMHALEEAELLQHHLERLISRELVVLIPRRSGQREDRYMHLLGGEVDVEAMAAAMPAARGGAGPDAAARIDELEARVAALEARLQELTADGVQPTKGDEI